MELAKRPKAPCELGVYPKGSILFLGVGDHPPLPTLPKISIPKINQQ
jgi:hypothetical protein